jgi:hypothetical protein
LIMIRIIFSWGGVVSSGSVPIYFVLNIEYIKKQAFMVQCGAILVCRSAPFVWVA